MSKDTVDHKLAVTVLHLPEYDKTRAFPGLSALKIEKKDRHNRVLVELTKFIDDTDENVVQSVLQASRKFREEMEVVDVELNNIYKSLQNEQNIIVKSEDDLLEIKEVLKNIIKNRDELINEYSHGLEMTEIKRAEIIGKELKVVVDKLIAIAHQLRDEIEHVIESEAFELNAEIITNRKSHAEKIREARINQIKIEADSILNWENGMLMWRKLRHNQAIEQFISNIESDMYTDPQDRKDLMEFVRNQQVNSRQSIQQQMNAFMSITSDSISHETVSVIQKNLAALNENEIVSIQECYNNMNRLRENLQSKAQNRVEKLRIELHEYGALQVEPDMINVSNVLQEYLQDSSLSEFWKLSGALKTEIQMVVESLRDSNFLHHEEGLRQLEDRVKSVSCGFLIKEKLRENNNSNILESVRNQVTKLRSATKSEVFGIVSSIVPLLQNLEGIEYIDSDWIANVHEISEEIQSEITQAQIQLNLSRSKTLTGNNSAAAFDDSASKMSKTSKALTSAGKSVLFDVDGTSKAGRSTQSKRPGSMLGTASVTSGRNALPSIDLAMAKAWIKKLGIYFYSCDLPIIYREILNEVLRRIQLKRNCNALVDTDIEKVSSIRIHRLDVESRKLNDAVANYLEVQATRLFQTSTNLVDFYLALATVQEKHRESQTQLDNKNEDELWDLKEDFRIDLEDMEAEYEKLCQKIRESITQDEIDGHYQAVLDMLEKIQESYRKYHSDACFRSDKYALILIDEFQFHLKKICNNLFMQPSAAHPIITNYVRIFDGVERLNQKYFESNEAAAGVTRVDPTQGTSEIVDEENLDANVLSHTTNPETSDQQLLYATPFWNSKLVTSEENSHAEKRKANFFAGVYKVQLNYFSIFEKFFVDGAFSSEPAQNNEISKSDEVKIDKNISRPSHPDCPWLSADCSTSNPLLSVLPIKSDEEMDALHPTDREEYELALSNAFIPLKSNPEDESAVLQSWSDEQKQSYLHTKILVEKVKTSQQQKKDSSFVRSNPPRDRHGNCWVSEVVITEEQVQHAYQSIRQNLLMAVEKESFVRISKAEKLNETRKSEFTDQLEDRIRNHWPRRGRVETMIKQPRESELFSHKEKTWRHIQNIQEKMLDAKRRFDEIISSSLQSCDQYIRDISSLRNSLGSDFKNLAVLQGIDVKARSLTLEFQASCTADCETLQKICDQETKLSIIQFAREFRKVCPLQAPGVKGGYSEAELEEISGLVESQCVEIQSIVDQEWKVLIEELVLEQMQSLKSQDEFIAKYDKCVQDVSMSEGLGQKYGAPRRRAQERIRTEVSRDEQCAGKLDEILAKLEFLSSEWKPTTLIFEDDPNQNGASSSVQLERMEKLSPTTREKTQTRKSPNSKSLEVSINASKNDSTFITSADQHVVDHFETQLGSCRSVLRNVNDAWSMLCDVRIAFQQRINYLTVRMPTENGDIVNEPSPSWLSVERVSLLLQSYSMYDSKDITEWFPNKKALIESYNEIDNLCRKETRELYSSEGVTLTSSTGKEEDAIPDSLKDWLHESRDKILGRHGYRERAWKRLWGQIARSEDLLARHITTLSEHHPNESHEMGLTLTLFTIPRPVGVPRICLRGILDSFAGYALVTKNSKVKEFEVSLRVWEKGREKHERLLRPRLGSPDVIDELNALDRIESERSIEMVDNIKRFRSGMIRSQVELMKRFFEDIIICSKSIMHLIDTTTKQELVQVPPDTEIPKKHLTLKRLRKAQRIREDVANGGEDKSIMRIWSSIHCSTIVAFVRTFEEFIIDLGESPTDTTLHGTQLAKDNGMAPSDTGTNAKKVAAPAAKKGAKDIPAASPVGDPTSRGNGVASLIPDVWTEAVEAGSKIGSMVSSAHRNVVLERDHVIEAYASTLSTILSDIKDSYNQTLAQEKSWNERWMRQVDMLKNGKIG